MGNKPSSQPTQNSNKTPQRAISLNRLEGFKPAPLEIQNNNRLLGQHKPPSILKLPNPAINVMKSPSNFINEQMPLNPPPVFKKPSIIKSFPPINEIDKNQMPYIGNNRMLDSESISSYHFQEPTNEKDFKTPNKHHENHENGHFPPSNPINLHEFKDENLDQAGKFRLFLLKKSKNDLHLKFFREDPNLMFISLPIVAPNKKNPQKLIPFRNKLCKKSNCVYHIDDLIKKYSESMFSNYLNFICFNCKKVIDLNNFSLDATLSKIIDEIWANYNRVSLQCKEVTLLRTGFWEPNLPEYLKLLDKNLAKTQKHKRVITNVDEVAEMKTVKTQKKIKDFDDFTLEEYKQLEESLFKKKLKPDKRILYFENYEIMMQDYLHLKSESAFPVNLMSFFIQYIQEFQESHYDKYNKESGNKTFIFGIKLLKFDKFYKKAKYEYLPGQSNIYKGKISHLLEIFNLISIMILCENRWIVLLIDLNTYDYYPIDFLQENLSNFSLHQLSELSQYIVKKEFDINLKRLNVYNVPKLDFLQDFGLYACYFFNKFITNPDLVEISVNIKEKNLFKKQFSWLILKHCDILQQPVLFFEFPKTKAEKQAEENYQKERQLLRKRRKELEKEKELQKQKELEEENLKQNTSESQPKSQNSILNEIGLNPANTDKKASALSRKKSMIDPENLNEKKNSVDDKKKSEFFSIYQNGEESQSQIGSTKEIKEDKPNATHIKEVKTAKINSIPEIIFHKASNRPSMLSKHNSIIANNNDRKNSSLIENRAKKSIDINSNGNNNEKTATLQTRKSIFLRKKSTVLEEAPQRMSIDPKVFMEKVHDSLKNIDNGNPNDLINLSKEEFVELIKNFKEKLVLKIREKLKIEEAEMAHEEIKVEDEVIVMNKIHLKKLLEEYENYLRNHLDDADEEIEIPPEVQKSLLKNTNNNDQNPGNFTNMPPNYPPYYDPYNYNNVSGYGGGENNMDENILNALTEEQIVELLGAKYQRNNDDDDDESESEESSDDDKKSKKSKKNKGKKGNKKKGKSKNKSNVSANKSSKGASGFPKRKKKE